MLIVLLRLSGQGLARAVGLPVGGQIGLGVIADPAGDKIAVTVSAGGGEDGMAVLDRQGHLLEL